VSAWWAGATPGQRVLATIAALLAAFTLVGAGLRLLLGQDPGGPASSAFGTAENGIGALADLAEAEGAQVERLRAPLDQLALHAGPTEGVTLVVAAPASFAPEEAAEAERFVRAGGRLVTTGRPEPFGDLLGELEWSSGGPRQAQPVVPLPETDGVGEVETGRSGSWRSYGSWLPVLAGGGEVIAVTTQVGAGEILAIADPAVLWNDRLAERDNAAFGLAALGAGGGQRNAVLFAEAAHGYGPGGGIRLAPAAWKWSAAFVLGVALVFLWSAASRFGPPDLPERSLAPPRHRYAESLATTLVRTGDRDAGTAPLRARAERLAARTAVGSAAAAPPPLTVPDDDEQLIELGRLAARIERGEPWKPGDPHT
jgi:hypothetical protein